MIDVARGNESRFTTGASYDAAPIWSADGTNIAFFSVREGRWQLWQKATNGAADEKLLLNAPIDLVTQDWSPDGKFFLYGQIDLKTRNSDLSVLDMRVAAGESQRLTPFVHSAFHENFARFSPDGRWVVYQSDESGKSEIYVRPFRTTDTMRSARWQISTRGGIEPRWSRDGTQIFYIAADNELIAVDVKANDSIDVGIPRPLFRTRPVGVLRYDVTAKADRFLVAMPTEQTTSAPLSVILNWQEELKRRASTN